jgi:uncharacterized membrane protein YgcG
MWPFKRRKTLTPTDRWSICRRYRAGTPRRVLAAEYDGFDGTAELLDSLIVAAHAADVSFPLRSEPPPSYDPPPSPSCEPGSSGGYSGGDSSGSGSSSDSGSSSGGGC